uniref:Uncharacterized protein n=1 Tax=Magallana gigas TaxID=29159 RepID=A0A8W8K9Y4_MAGGI
MAFLDPEFKEQLETDCVWMNYRRNFWTISKHQKKSYHLLTLELTNSGARWPKLWNHLVANADLDYWLN